MIKIGKVGKVNQNTNRKLKKLFIDKGITACEIRRLHCTRYNFLGFAHRHKRVWYRNCPEKLSEYNQVLLACTNCHQEIEYNEELAASIFERLRGKEI